MATIKLQYFKPSGKWGYDAELKVEDNRSPYSILDQVKQMAADYQLPGLASGHWEGYVHLDLNDHPMAFPMLLKLGSF